VTKLEKAKLFKIDSALKGERQGGAEPVLTCPINPDSLKISYSNAIEPAKTEEDKGKKGSGKAKQPAPAGGQFVSKLGTKLAVTLVLDIALPDAGGVKDVRTLTTKVLGLLTPDDGNAPPGVELLWGSLLFRGFLESVEESLEFFSPDGVALRATLALVITRPAMQTGVNANFKPSAASSPGSKKPAAGTVPLTEAPAGGNVQGLFAQAQLGVSVGVGASASWQDVATANGIDDPLRLGAGQRLDLSVGARVRLGTGS
jgi:Contractile injection system tube protein